MVVDLPKAAQNNGAWLYGRFDGESAHALVCAFHVLLIQFWLKQFHDLGVSR